VDTPRYAFYGDDFTGATDTLATLTQAGLASLLFLGVPDAARLAVAGPLDAIGIAGAARTMDPAAMSAELAPVAQFFAELRAPLLHYKCCSTFDSAPRTGNLAVALRALRPAAPNAFVPIVGGQPSLGRYCAFGQLFASAGAGGEVHRIDRHPTMSRHPVTPMGEADLRRHLALQGLVDIALVDWRTLDDGDAAVATHTSRALAAQSEAVLFDVLRAEHLAVLGRLFWARAQQAPLLVLGASSVAQALVAHWQASGELAAAPVEPRIAPAEGPVFVLAGSQSPVTAAQVERAGAAYRQVAIDAARVVAEPAALDALAAQCAAWLAEGRPVLARTTPARDGGPASLDLARACGRLLAQVLARSPAVRRVGVAGGDTSSLALRELEVWALGCVGRVANGVTLVRARSGLPRLDGLELMLKGGQMGPPELFETLLRGT